MADADVGSPCRKITLAWAGSAIFRQVGRGSAELFAELEPAGLELRLPLVELLQLLLQALQAGVVRLVVPGERVVQRGPLGGDPLEAAVDRRDLLLRGAPVGAAQRRGRPARGRGTGRAACRGAERIRGGTLLRPA